MIIHGDCIEAMAAMEPESVDAIVTDPPYNLTGIGRRFQGSGGTFRPDGTARYDERRSGGFMGKTWDGTGIAFDPETWRLAYRVAKPSAYLLAFGGTRTVHRMTVALEDAGWIIRDLLVWAYASGFPKSKASLKPAWEPIVLARKPGPLRDLAIDACRIPFVSEADREFTAGRNNWGDRMWDGPAAIQVGERPVNVTHERGRWPANIVLTATEDGRAIFDGGWEGVVGGGEVKAGIAVNRNKTPGEWSGNVVYGARPVVTEDATYGDTGTYSRFFLIPKADRADREPVLPPDGHDRAQRFTTHPTVKPTELMRHLVRLVTPPGGTVLDPFAGSGSTLIAAEMEGFAWIGIEREESYVEIARARLNGTQRGLGLVG